MKVETIQWVDIYPIWKYCLWPGRTSPIEPATSMVYLGGYELKNKMLMPTLLGIKNKDKLIAVNSVVMCIDGSARSRGLWVDDAFRGHGLAKAILLESINVAKLHQASHLWTVPRKSAMPAYESVGFKQSSDWFDEGMEYGPNCYATVSLE